RVETEEAWTLGVTAARQRPIRLSRNAAEGAGESQAGEASGVRSYAYIRDPAAISRRSFALIREEADLARFPRHIEPLAVRLAHAAGDRKSTRLNSSHSQISYAVFCLKKKTKRSCTSTPTHYPPAASAASVPI